MMMQDLHLFFIALDTRAGFFRAADRPVSLGDRCWSLAYSLYSFQLIVGDVFEQGPSRSRWRTSPN